MIRAGLSEDADFEAWRAAARPLLVAGIEPGDIAWLDTDQASLLMPPINVAVTQHAELRVPQAFVDVADDAALFGHRARFDLLYRILWRLKTERHLMSDRTDADVERLHRMASAVRRETHKMHAYVRFRLMEKVPGGRFVAWHEPRHFVVRKAAPFFAERFPAFNWSIVTPTASAHWDGVSLSFGPGGSRSDCPADDATEEDWRVYYESIFNPARLNVPAMLRHMPRRYWSTMPETASIPRLIREAEERTDIMLKAAPTTMRKRLNRAEAEAREDSPAPATAHSLDELRDLLPGCRRCALWRNATQPVAGEGPRTADIMLVGEQPGDQEDLSGKPFVGPAGGVLNRALDAAGIERDKLYVTNAVKHFKYELRGKRRLHQKPDTSEVRACETWLDQERRLVAPRIIVALGGTALVSMKGSKATLKGFRGRLTDEGDGTKFIATYHPSYILRIPEKAGQEAAFKMLVEDLTLAAKALAQLSDVAVS